MLHDDDDDDDDDVIAGPKVISLLYSVFFYHCKSAIHCC